MRFAIISLFAVLLLTPACPAQELLYPDYWFAYNTPELNRPVANEPGIYEGHPEALPLPNGNTFVTYVDSQYDNCYQIINPYGQLVFPEPQPLKPDVVTNGLSHNARIVSDGAGGVFAVWIIGEYDTLTGTYAQRVDSLGNRLWGDSAIKVSVRGDIYLNLSTDGMGGLLIPITGCGRTVVHRLDGSGQQLWGENGATACRHEYQKDHAAITHDGSGGAYVVWNDYRPPYAGPGSIWMQHLDANGNVTWSPNGELICGGTHIYSELFPDEMGGFLIHIVWGGDNHVKRIDMDAQVLWSHESVSHGSTARMVPGEPGYLYIGSIDENSIVRAQRLDVEGNTYWPTPGSLEGAVLAYPNLQLWWASAYCYNDSHFYGLYCVGEFFDQWIYAQKLNQYGNRCWGDEGIAMCHHDDSLFYAVGTFSCVPDDTGGITGVYLYNGNPIEKDVYAKHCFSDGTLGGPKPVKVIPPTRAQISSVSNGEIRLDLPEPGLIQLDIYNLLGRRIRSITEAYFSAGMHTVRFDDRGLTAGVYFIRLKADCGQAVVKTVIVR